ncbi:hypothetical protein [Paucisalibacillus globulus]|uniref:hypothetical protein n=1 Tax=Paucisalibacillus globulus TaxID=351095 RepID=UPI00159689D5|nr:hypothetical protein [Paucisalibacillus globulus]
MAVNKGIVPNQEEIDHEEHSYKGALASSLIFVGGGIILVIALLLVLYMTRV